MGYNYPYKKLAIDTIKELRKSKDSNIVDKFIKELKRLDKNYYVVDKKQNNSFMKGCIIGNECSPSGCYRYYVCEEEFGSEKSI